MSKTEDSWLGAIKSIGLKFIPASNSSRMRSCSGSNWNVICLPAVLLSSTSFWTAPMGSPSRIV